ncbi:TetR/AcrR family transcriptional regulator [Amycolatopsis echigonensis]|uniref:TetR/AcrR family transcriptional regulator n=1 Tax=Amycolatopsis echigonensis TaxID=2576905 RepID=A0A8E1W5I3_9PSEU|nr:TetR family transcriptional regulator [Amycolatopsis echigonensis]MBB2504698.1 TetR/AcrR family transcriptional regulator [Amycolatopsis echigonensis]
MTTVEPVADTRTRLLATALRLFAEHGVEGTSLQMIADELGVTKAAVYYHFKTKAEITEAVAEPGIRELDELVVEAAKHRRHGARVDHLLDGFVDLVVRHRVLVALFSSDPGIDAALAKSRHGVEGVKQALITIVAGPEPDVTGRVAAIVAFTGIAMAGGSPDLAEVDDETLRQELIGVGRRLLGRPRRRVC